MPYQQYDSKPATIQTILDWVENDEISVPEIQRPFVWKATQISNLLDSLYKGYPIGYLVTWLTNPTPREDGTFATQRLLIDGQQRVVALRTALLGHKVLTSTYEKKEIPIEFNPATPQFRVRPAKKHLDHAWVPITQLFTTDTSLTTIAEKYISNNPTADYDQVLSTIRRVQQITHLHIGIVELKASLHIRTVADIFTRINASGTKLNETDFAMTKIASRDEYDGTNMRKTIDYFCRLLRKPEYLDELPVNDPQYAQSEYFGRVKWLSDNTNSLYFPGYKDLLRVAFCSRFDRAKISELSLLLSGHSFEEQRQEETFAKQAFDRLREGLLDTINPTHFRRFMAIVQSAGFNSTKLIRNRNALNFAYILFLRCAQEGSGSGGDDVISLVRRWLVMSLLKGRYSTTVVSKMESDIRGMKQAGSTAAYCDQVVKEEMSSSYWNEHLPNEIRNARQNSRYTPLFWVAQMHQHDKAFLVKTMPVAAVFSSTKNIHHVYPVHYLSSEHPQAIANRLANLVVTTDEVNLAISDSSPHCYFSEVVAQCARGSSPKYGDIVDIGDLEDNFCQNCIPESIMHGTIPDYQAFLDARAKLMARRIQSYFDAL